MCNHLVYHVNHLDDKAFTLTDLLSQTTTLLFNHMSDEFFEDLNTLVLLHRDEVLSELNVQFTLLFGDTLQFLRLICIGRLWYCTHCLRLISLDLRFVAKDVICIMHDKEELYVIAEDRCVMLKQFGDILHVGIVESTLIELCFPIFKVDVEDSTMDFEGVKQLLIGELRGHSTYAENNIFAIFHSLWNNLSFSHLLLLLLLRTCLQFYLVDKVFVDRLSDELNSFEIFLIKVLES